MRRIVLVLLVAMLCGACNGAAPNTIGTPSATANTPATPVVSTCPAAITTDETPLIGGIDSLTWQADLVIEGTVLQSLPAVWPIASDVRHITTDTIVEVEQRIVGNAGETIRIRRAGGTIGCSSLDNAITPELRDGDRLLLFLIRDDTPGLDPAYRLLGEGQGYWQLRTENQVDMAVKFFHTDTGIVGDARNGEIAQEIIEQAKRAHAAGTPTPDNGDGNGLYITSDWATSAGIVPLYLTEGIVVTGKVSKQLPAQWTTRDGKRPVNLQQALPDDQTIVTPIVIELDATPLYDSYGLSGTWTAGQQITVLANGGQVDGNFVSFGTAYVSQPVYVPGERVLLLLTYERYYGGRFGRVLTPNGLAWNVSSKYVVAGERIYSPNPHDPPGSLLEFEQRIEAVQNGWP